jgi:hypothetical protein
MNYPNKVCIVSKEWAASSGWLRVQIGKAYARKNPKRPRAECARASMQGDSSGQDRTQRVQIRAFGEAEAVEGRAELGEIR